MANAVDDVTLIRRSVLLVLEIALATIKRTNDTDTIRALGRVAIATQDIARELDSIEDRAMGVS